MQNISQREKDLDLAINLCNGLQYNSDLGECFEEYSKVYSFTNENLADMFMQMKLSCKKNALSVLSSGDHAFNLIYLGIPKIDTFDSNRLTEYYALGLKKTAIECLSYKEFMSLFSPETIIRTRKKQLDVIDYIVKNMPKEYSGFFEEFLKYLKRTSLGIISDLFKTDTDVNEKQIKNLWLRSEEDYRKMQKKLNKAEITFKYCDVFDLPKQFGQYDLVELSNVLSSIMRYQGKGQKEKIESLIKAIYDNNLTPHGELLFDYVWSNSWSYPDPCKEIFYEIDYAKRETYKYSTNTIRSLKK